MSHRWLILFWGLVTFLTATLVQAADLKHPHANPVPYPCTRTGLPAGTVLISRNVNEQDNTTPGYWNHLAICAGNVVIESQEGVGVVGTPVNAFLARPYARITARPPVSPVLGQKAAYRVLGLVGTPYAPYSSVFHGLGGNGPARLRLGLNCVSLVEEGYRLPGINRPDGVLKYAGCCQHNVFSSPEVLR